MNKAFEVYLHQDLLRVFPIEHDEVTIGRGNTNFINLPHPRVSRRHGVFHCLDDRIVYRDLSRNGSIVNGSMINGSEVEIGHGDSIEYGDFRVVFNAHSQKRDIQKTDLLFDDPETKHRDLGITVYVDNDVVEQHSLESKKITVGKDSCNTIVINHDRADSHAMTFIALRDAVHLNIDTLGGVSLNGQKTLKGLYKLKLYDRITYLGLHLRLETLNEARSEKSLVGRSEAMQRVRNDVETAAKKLKNFSVLITGESGTGKEMVARSIHALSGRKHERFVAVNCSSIPESLAESLLFGHVSGSFTNANKEHAGHFQTADGGTLFLDEIGDLPPGIQVKLLRAIECQEIQPVGSATTLKVDVRILAGTNKNISITSIRANKGFRDDLYYRLSGYEIEIPPLRSRKDDIPDLVHHFHKELLIQDPSLENIDITADALKWAQSYDWPGNVRELKHETQKAILLADHVVNQIPISKTFKTPTYNHPILMDIARLLSEKKSNKEIMQELNLSRTAFFRWKQML